MNKQVNSSEYFFLFLKYISLDEIYSLILNLFMRCLFVVIRYNYSYLKRLFKLSSNFLNNKKKIKINPQKTMKIFTLTANKKFVGLCIIFLTVPNWPLPNKSLSSSTSNDIVQSCGSPFSILVIFVVLLSSIRLQYLN